MIRETQELPEPQGLQARKVTPDFSFLGRVLLYHLPPHLVAMMETYGSSRVLGYFSRYLECGPWQEYKLFMRRKKGF